jgi:hypothetical protein
MGTIPAVPVFPAGLAASSAGLNELCTAITWCMSGKPLCQLTQNAAQTIANTTLTAVAWQSMIINRDSMWSSSANTRATANTPGIYLAAASVIYATHSVSSACYTMFRVTTGSNNPAGSGLQTYLAAATQNNDGVAWGAASQTLTPYMYDGDYVEVVTWQNTGVSVTTLITAQGPSWFTISLASG